MLIPFHTAMTFAPYAWFLRNDELNLATIGLVLVLDQFQMESLFLVAGAATWFWVIGILYLAKRFLNFSNRFLQYGNDAVLPYYIIHCTPVAVIGLYVVQWDMDVLPKYIINTILAFVATVVLYELIKRINVTRFLFGMRLKKKPVPEETGPVPYWRRQEE